jgi:hypothetical protein
MRLKIITSSFAALSLLAASSITLSAPVFAQDAGTSKKVTSEEKSEKKAPAMKKGKGKGKKKDAGAASPK